MGSGLRICRKCLPPGVGREEFFESLARYIERMDESVRVDQKIYEERLAQCRQCDKLRDGMCRLCGCFVELRAAQKVRKCPDLPARWKGVSDETEYFE